MDYTSWDDQRTELRRKFTTDKITKSTRKELEHYLVVLANSTRKGDTSHHDETERFESVISHLLHIRISEQLHWRSMVAAGIAIVVSVLALVQGYMAHRTKGLGAAPTVSAPISQKTPQPVPTP